MRKTPSYGVEREHRRQAPAAGFGTPCGLMADLIAQQSIRTMGDGESGASTVQVSVPEFNSTDFRVVKKRRCVIRARRSNDKQNFLSEGVEKT